MESGPGVTQITGLVAMILGIAAPATLGISLVLLRLYRRSVARYMRRQSEAAFPDDSSKAPAAMASDRAYDSQRLVLEMQRKPWLMALRYGVAGGVAAALTVVTMFALEGFEFFPLRTLTVFVVSTWPIALTSMLIAAVNRREQRVILGSYAALYGILSVLMVALSPTTSFGQLLALFFARNFLPTVFVWMTLQRSIRAVGPLVLAFLVTALFGANLAIDILLERYLVETTHVLFGLGFRSQGVFAGVILIGFLLFAAMAAVALQLISSLYRRKQISDLTLTLDGIWLVFGVSHALFTTFSAGARGFALGFIPFLGYRLTTSLLARLTRPKPLEQVPRLLFLRVFALGKRSATLWDMLAKTFRHVGSVRMIAGPDLVTTTIEPHEFLDFLTRRLSRHFISSRAVLEASIRAIDDAPDLDGRFRVNEFFCNDDTWRPAFRALLSSSDIVLMDLRSYSPANAGAKYELEQLVLLADLRRVVLLIDDSTDESFFRETLHGATSTSGLVLTKPDEAFVVRSDLHQPDTRRQFVRALSDALGKPLAIAGDEHVLRRRA